MYNYRADKMHRTYEIKYQNETIAYIDILTPETNVQKIIDELNRIDTINSELTRTNNEQYRESNSYSRRYYNLKNEYWNIRKINMEYLIILIIMILVVVMFLLFIGGV